MAVVVKYIVVRNGVEKMTFTTKKEADAYDKMLDIADEMYEFIESADLGIEEDLLESLSLFLANNNDTAASILKGTKPKSKPKKPPEEAPSEEAKKPEPKKTKK